MKIKIINVNMAIMNKIVLVKDGIISFYYSISPSTITDNVITCLECLYNMNDWINKFCCLTSLYTDNEGNIYQKKEEMVCYNSPPPDES